ncbi:MAG: hypothetical protein NC117_10060 [Pseudoflavonifractor sp.]|nr:hypothetical protein [Pseudoflavonifractor sp.]
MVDFNYINSLPEATSVLSQNAYKVTERITSTVTSSSTAQAKSIYILHGGILTLSGTLPNNSKIYIMGELHVGEGKTLDIGLGSSIIMGDGGLITGSGILNANESYLEAPIGYIFGPEIQIEGFWAIEAAYPQWLTPKTPHKALRIKQTDGSFELNSDITLDGFDWATPINRAISMKKQGRVRSEKRNVRGDKTKCAGLRRRAVGEHPKRNVLIAGIFKRTTSDNNTPAHD